MNIALIGYGKMGKAIEAVALKTGHEIVLKIDEGNVEQFTKDNLQRADAAIEFSHPTAAFKNITQCMRWNLPVVCGTTGWLDKLEEAKEICSKENGSFIYASNFSIGVNLFFALNKQLASLMKNIDDYDVMIEETHHVHKKDAPSGTALTLAEGILSSGKKDQIVQEETHHLTDLFIKSNRIDEVPGTHVVDYFSLNDSIEIKHTAFNRTGFAAGAVAAAVFLKDRTGIFTMGDVLGIS